MLPQLIDPFPPQVKTLSLKSSHPFWNGHSIGRVVSKANATKKMRKIKRDNEAGLVDGTILMYHRYKDTDLQELSHGAVLDSSKPIKIVTYYQYKKSLMILKG